MTIRQIIRRISLSACALVIATSASALDLPTTTVRGKQLYYYKVTGKETVYGLSKRFGITREEIVKYNPGVADGIKKGTTLYFPVDEFSDRKGDKSQSAAAREPEKPVATEPAEDLTLRPVTMPKTLFTVKETRDKNATIAVLLPFMLDDDNQSKQTKLYTDFYKGMLIAADTLSNRGDKVEILAIDTKGDPDAIKDIFASSEKLRNAAVIIAPDNDATLSAIASEAEKNGSFVLNVFNVKDSTYFGNPYMVQANIPHTVMYAKAAEAIFDDFGDYTPVIIRNTAGRSEKSAFTSYLMDLCNTTGRRCMEVEYDSALNRSDLSMIDTDPQGNYVIIPSSGSLAEFNKFCHVVKALQDNRRVAESEGSSDMGKVALFGYPDWTAFRGDALDMLHTLEATIYSRFYDDFMSFSSRTINSDFRRWYGSAMIESVPSQGILGYDTATYLIKNLRSHDGQYRADNGTFRGIQSTFNFVHPDTDGPKQPIGYYNKALYIITYLPGTGMSARIY